jgi:hypothetical protein
MTLSFREAHRCLPFVETAYAGQPPMMTRSQRAVSTPPENLVFPIDGTKPAVDL